MRVALVAAVFALACSKPATEQESKPEPKQQVDQPAAKPPPKRKPRGWEAYEKRVGQKPQAIETAADATLLRTDGEKVQLSGLWAEHNVALVFYRGHW